MIRWDKISTKFWTMIVWRLPKRLVYWCTIRLGAVASAEMVEEVPKITLLDALHAYRDPIGYRKRIV